MRSKKWVELISTCTLGDHFNRGCHYSTLTYFFLVFGILGGHLLYDYQTCQMSNDKSQL